MASFYDLLAAQGGPMVGAPSPMAANIDQLRDAIAQGFMPPTPGPSQADLDAHTRAVSDAMKTGYYGKLNAPDIYPSPMMDALKGAGWAATTLPTPGMFEGVGAKLLAGVAPIAKRALGIGAEDAARAAAPAVGGAMRAWAEPMSHDLEALVRANQMPVQAGDKRISSRWPKAVGATEDPLTQQLAIDLPSYMRTTPRADPFTQNMGLVTTYPGFKKFEGMSPEEIFRGASDQMRGNMQFIRDNAPNAFLQRSPLWYEGANQMAGDLASRWGVPRESASGALASLSPQKDWFQNVSNTERVGDIMFGPNASRRMTSEMESLYPTLNSLNSAKNMLVYRAIQGKSLENVMAENPLGAAMWIRLFDEAHNAPGYRSITPEGMFGPPVLNDDGTLARRAWNSGGEIAKAVRALQSGGDMNIISPSMGYANKVRSFYNNIELPMDRLYGDVTSDTHQVAAAHLSPLSGNSYPVAHNFGNSLDPKFQGADFPGHASSSSLTGIGGTYPLYVDAARQFARDNQMLPRAGQSQAWEAVRELFPDTFKTDKNMQVVEGIWRAHDRGELSLDDARRRILDFAAPAGIAEPAWARSSAPVYRASRASSYR
jgi:hypothetical protein